MSRYFYHFRTGHGDLLPDQVGSEHEDEDAAVLEAAMSGAELMRGRPSFTRGGVYEVHDEVGRLIERVPVSTH